MRREGVIFISNEFLSIITGERKNDMIQIEDYMKLPLPEGVILNGVVIDDVELKRQLQTLKDKGIEVVHLIVDSAKIIAKQLTIPFMKRDQIEEFIKNEVSLDESSKGEMIYDYCYLGEGIEVKKTYRILAVGVAKSFIESYIDVFKQAHIKILSIDYSINALMKFTSIIPGLIDKSYIVTQVDGNNLTSILFIDNNYTLTDRSRIFSTKGTPEFDNDVIRSISHLVQFSTSSQKSAPISDVYVMGLEKENSATLFERIQDTLTLQAQTFPKSKFVYAKRDGNNTFDLNEYVLPLGHFGRR